MHMTRKLWSIVYNNLYVLNMAVRKEGRVNQSVSIVKSRRPTRNHCNSTCDRPQKPYLENEGKEEDERTDTVSVSK